MNDEINWLITLCNTNTLLRCALKVKREQLSEDCIKYPMEPENKEKIKELLPEHVRSCGPIVEITQIFEIEISENKNDTIIIEAEGMNETWQNLIFKGENIKDITYTASRIILKTKDKYIVVKDKHIPTPYEIDKA